MKGISACSAVFLLFNFAATIQGAPARRREAAIRRLDGSAITPAEIDAAAARPMRAAQVTGMGLAVLNHGEIVYEKAYGWRDVEKRLPLTPDSVMTAASLSKSAFAALVVQLAEAGVLNLDTPVAGYLPKPLPEYRGYADLAGDRRYERITARMLLSHTSGFPNWRRFEPDGKLKIHFEPGSRFAYSGEGIRLLQLVVETVTKRPMEELMSQYVFKPAGMTRTSMVWQARFEDDFANGYDEQGRRLGPERRETADTAGGMQTTLADYARFLSAILQGRLMSTRARAMMFRPQIAIHTKHEFPSLTTEMTHENDAIRLSYGLGWGLDWSPQGEAFFKEGHDEGWRHYAVCFRQPKSGLLIMTNSSNGESLYLELLDRVLKDTHTPVEWEQFTTYKK